MREFLALVRINLRHGPARTGWIAWLATALLVLAARLDLALTAADRYPEFAIGLGALLGLALAVLAGALPALAASRMSVSGAGLSFLEGFPVTRAWPYLADLVSALLSALPSVLLLSLYPTVADLERLGWPRRQLPAPFAELFASPAAVLTWSSGIAILAAGTTFLARAGSSSDLKAVAEAIAIATVAVLAGVLGLAAAEIEPGWQETALLLALAGAGAAALGLALFIVAPPHVDSHHRGELARTNAVLGFWAFVLAEIATGALVWQSLAPGESLGIGVLALAAHTEDRTDQVLLWVSSRRSGGHHVLADLAGRRWTDLGRRLEVDAALAVFDGARWQGRPLLHDGGPVLAGGSRWAGLLPDPAAPLKAFGPEVGRTTHLLATRRAVAGKQARLHDFAWTDHGWQLYIESLCAADGGAEPCRAYLVVQDRNGAEIKRVPLEGAEPPVGETTFSLLVGAGRALAWAATGSPEPPEHVLIDLATLTDQHLRLPGPVIELSSGLDRALCLVQREQAGRRLSALVQVELPSLTRRILLGEEDLPSRPALDPEQVRSDGAAWGPQVTGAGVLVFAPADGGTSVVFDVHLERGVWLEERIRDGLRVFALHTIDVQSGARRVLVSPAELPRLPLLERASGNVPRLLDLAPDGSVAVLDTGGGVWRIDVATGERGLIAARERPPSRSGALPADRIEVSPRLDRAARIHTVSADGAILTVGVPTLLAHPTTATAQATWIDDERLLLIEGGKRVVLVDVNGGSPPRELFPGWATR